MIRKLQKNEQGLALPLILLVVVLLAAVGGAGYFVYSKNSEKKDSTNGQSVSNKAVEEECKKEIDDKDFCKFASSFSLDESFKSVITTTSPEGTNVIAMETDGNGGTRSVTSTNGQVVGEFIGTKEATYIKDLSDGYWTKYSMDISDEATDIPSDDLDFDFDEDETTPDNTQYKSLGKEACGNLTCFKYQIIDPTNPSDESYVWFDDDDYKLRRWQFKNSEGTSEITYEYTSVTITEPSPLKDAPSVEGIDAATQAEIDAMLEQYAQ